MASKKASWVSVLDSVAPHIPGVISRILLYGPPGTGKSSWPFRKYGDARCMRETIDTSKLPSDLIGTWRLEASAGGTRTAWADGPAVAICRRAAANPGETFCLVLDEVDQCSPEVRAFLHQLMDDRAIAGIPLPTGERVQVPANLLIVGTSNSSPGELSEALLDRFDLALACVAPADGILASLPLGMRSALESHYAQSHGAGKWSWQVGVSARSMIRLNALTSAMGDLGAAADLLFGENGATVVNMVSESV